MSDFELRNRTLKQSAPSKTDAAFETASLAPTEATLPAYSEAGPSSSLLPNPTNVLTKYNLYYTPSYLNATLHTGDISSPVHYYMQSKSCTTLTPRLLLHRGSSKKSPIVAFAKAKYTSRHMAIGLGDCEAKDKSKAHKHDDEDAVSEQEIQLLREKNVFRRSDYRFETLGPDGETARLVWKKNKAACQSSVYDCVNESDGAVVGRMLSGGALNLQKGGEIWVDEVGLGVGMRELVIVGAFAIWAYEALSYRSVLRGYAKDGEAAVPGPRGEQVAAV